jgi:predicted nucleotidyltransferase
MNLADRIIACVAPHPTIRSIRLVGSRAHGSATEFSDWDFRVEANDFVPAAETLPHLLAPLNRWRSNGIG